MELNYFFFSFFAIIALVTAIVTVSSKHPVVSAMSLVGHFMMLAGLYLTLNAQFLAIMQVLVYTGAIMVLVVFVIMLLNLGNEETIKKIDSLKVDMRKTVAYLLGFAFVTQIAVFILTRSGELTTELSEKSIESGTVQGVGKVLFTEYLYPFEMISLLLIVAVIGALILGKKRHLI